MVRAEARSRRRFVEREDALDAEEDEVEELDEEDSSPGPASLPPSRWRFVGHPLQAHGLDPEELEPPSHHSSSNPSCHPLQAHGLDPEELEPPAHHSSSSPFCHQLEPHHLDPGSQVQVILNGPC